MQVGGKELQLFANVKYENYAILEKLIFRGIIFEAFNA